MGVLFFLLPCIALPEDAVAAFVIDETALPACTRILWGGLGVVDAPAADSLPADGQIWPSPPPSHMYNCCDARGGGNGQRAIGRHDFYRVGHDSGVFCDVGEVGLP